MFYRVYPNGYDDENSNYLGIFVKHKEGNCHQYLIKSVIQLLDAEGERRVPVELPGKILSSKQMHGTKKYIERESLMGNQQLYNEDSITFLLEAEICRPGTRVSSGGEEGVEEEREGESLLSRDLMQILRFLASPFFRFYHLFSGLVRIVMSSWWLVPAHFPAIPTSLQQEAQSLLQCLPMTC